MGPPRAAPLVLETRYRAHCIGVDDGLRTPFGLAFLGLHLGFANRAGLRRRTVSIREYADARHRADPRVEADSDDRDTRERNRLDRPVVRARSSADQRGRWFDHDRSR